MSLGCVSPGSLSILGRGTGAPQSGIYNLWAAGPRKGAAATQHVSTPQGAVSSPTCDLALLSPSFHPFVSAFQQSGYVPEIFQTRLLAALKIFPLLCPELLATFHHLCNHIYSSTGQGWNPPQKGKIQSLSFTSVVWCLHQGFITRLSTAPAYTFYCTANNTVLSRYSGIQCWMHI